MARAALELVPDGAAVPRPVSGRVAGASAQRVRIVDGALRCIARQGSAKTTLDDVARAAGCSRATVYRAFPGGKDAVMAAVVDTEVSRLFTDLAVDMAETTSLEDALVAGMSCAAQRISDHGPLKFLLDHEPEVVLPHLAFGHHDEVLRTVATFAAPFLGRWLAHDEAVRIAEWAARIVLSYLSCPAEGVDLTDPGCTRRIVRTYVLPGIRVLSAGTEAAEGAASVPRTHRLAPLPGPSASKGEMS